jgi:cytochrome c oxidase cbb3-type subunit 1
VDDFGRLRPLHTNLVIFAFGGCALFATSYYVVQRTCQTRLISDSLAAFTFWGWQAVIVGAIITLPLGYTTTKEYAELEWPLAILLAIVWVTYAWCSSAPSSSARPSTSMWATGSTAPSSW